MAKCVKKSKKFDKQYRALSKTDQKKAAKAIEYFLQDKHHPSLNFEKMHSVNHELYTIRISFSKRILLSIDEQEIIHFIDIGGHEIYERLSRIKL